MKVAEPLPFVGRLKIAVDDATVFVLSFERSIEAFAPQCRIQGILPADVVNDYLLDGFVAFVGRWIACGLVIRMVPHLGMLSGLNERSCGLIQSSVGIGRDSKRRREDPSGGQR